MFVPSDEDIAIIGMSCRVAGANSPSELWANLISSKDLQRNITRFSSEGYYHPEGGLRKGLTNVRKAYMLDDNVIDKFDNAFFYTTPIEAEAMDPQQRMLLEIAYETIENAGIPLNKFRGSDTAVYAGMEGCDYHTIASRDLNVTPKYLATGTPTCMAANRLSYFFDLSGPSMSVDTACSSSMAALHQAVRTLQHGDSKMAIVCGAKLILNPDMFMPSSELSFLSPSGKCQSFDAAADGYGRGEGALALLLKPLKLALTDRDPVRAVIKGTRLNQDGRTKGITLPSADAQRNNMQNLYDELGISSADIQYLEAHGTGTAAGDPLELSAVNAVYGNPRASPLVLGSVKSNIGHLEASSALASIIKVTLCLEKGQIPAQMHFKNPNPDIDFCNLTIPSKALPWPPAKKYTRRAAINTFGAGGTNGHAVLEALPKAKPKCGKLDRRPFLFEVSAADELTLRKLSMNLAEYIERYSPDLEDLSYTLLSRRSTLRRSHFFTASTPREAISSFRTDTDGVIVNSDGKKPNAIFLFTGQGAQWAQMGKLLILQSPLFEAVLSECDRHLSLLPHKPAWSIIEELHKPQHFSNIYRAEFSQPLCTALQIGLVVLLESWGLKADAVVGHSSGEICAAYAAGNITLRDAIVTSYYRGLVLGNAAHKTAGSMCAVGLGEDDVKLLLESYADRVQLAAVNSPTSCTLAGDQDAVRQIVEQLSQEKHFCRELRVDQAYHSHHMLPLAQKYQEMLSSRGVGLGQKASQTPMYSSLTASMVNPSELTPSYWAGNMTSTVRFSAALEQCVCDYPDPIAIVEIGPHPALKAPAQEILQDLGRSPVGYYWTCYRNEDDFKSLLRSAGAMIAGGLALKTATINAREVLDGLQCHHEPGNVLTDLPSYQWNHSTSFWAESRVSRNIRFRKFPRHELLGSRYVDDIPNRPSWRNHIMLKEVPWLLKLKENEFSELPPAVYILMALEACRQLAVASNMNVTDLTLSNIQFDHPFALSTLIDLESTVEFQLVARQNDIEPETYSFDIFSASSTIEGSWARHCSGGLAWACNLARRPKAPPRAILCDLMLLDHAKMSKAAFNHHLSDVRIGRAGSTGTFETKPNNVESYAVQPSVLDAILSLPPLSVVGQNLPSIYRLSSIASILVPLPPCHLSNGLFAVSIQETYHYKAKCNIEINQDSKSISLDGMVYESTNLIKQTPAMSSLFFEPLLLPDITKVSGGLETTLPQLAKLVTHKWPMIDIVIDAMTVENVKGILTAFGLLTAETRSFCRSAQCVGKPLESVHERVGFLEEFNAASRCHIIFSQWLSPSPQLLDKLHAGGLICTSSLPPEAGIEDTVERVGSIVGLGPQPWTLWRKFPTPAPLTPPQGRKVVLFASDRILHSLTAFKTAEHIPLNPDSVASFCQNQGAAGFDAIVVDDQKMSVITTWPGKGLIPWLQTLLISVHTLLWITRRCDGNPFANVAGSLLRTLQSEKPSLRVAWLILDESQGDYDYCWRERIEQAYKEAVDGGNELLFQSSSSEAKILRFYPDDQMSSDVGLIQPKRLTSRLGDMDYSVTFGAPGDPFLTSREPEEFHISNTQVARIQVEASVLDMEDYQLFIGTGGSQSSQARYGTFFAGQVVTSSSSLLIPGSTVVGWHPEHAHRKLIDCPPHYCNLRDGGIPAAEAASAYAITTLTLCAIDGVARARDGESVSIGFSGLLEDVVQQVCTDLGVVVVKNIQGCEADFLFNLDGSGCCFVSGKPVDIGRYLTSERGRHKVMQAWERHMARRLYPAVQFYELADVRKAFEKPQNPFLTVLLHQNASEATDHVSIYKRPARLFSETSEYVLIGGLGGLGRYICFWMFENGARYLSIISRGGSITPEANEVIGTLEASGACIRVVKADACNRQAVSQSLTRIREDRPIKGIINLAMILGDAPMATMTGEEWDRALRVKIDSSWILHEETLQDSLEFFILFSSIASVLGNRNQANYNVANTFLNALAEYRQSLDLPGISIALGAMTDNTELADMGVLYDLSKPDMLQILSRSGLTHLTKYHLAKIMEAAIHESPRRDRSLIVTGLEMFEREVDGSLAGRTEPLFWTELPEFGHLQRYKVTNIGSTLSDRSPLRDRVGQLSKEGNAESLKELVMSAFLTFLAQSLGFGSDTFDPKQALAMYGIDSLSGVACQYWFHKELGIDVSVSKVLGGASIEGIVEHACQML